MPGGRCRAATLPVSQDMSLTSQGRKRTQLRNQCQDAWAVKSSRSLVSQRIEQRLTPRRHPQFFVSRFVPMLLHCVPVSGSAMGVSQRTRVSRQRNEHVAAPMDSDRVGDLDSIREDQRATRSQMQAVIHGSERETPAAPVISIGKIEVQFLPQEPNPHRAAEPQQQQRTRGFEAYARARRGEPR